MMVRKLDLYASGWPLYIRSQQFVILRALLPEFLLVPMNLLYIGSCFLQEMLKYKSSFGIQTFLSKSICFPNKRLKNLLD